MNKKIIQIFGVTRSWLFSALCILMLMATSYQANAVTCAGAVVIPAGASLPYTSALTCGGANDLSAVSVPTVCGSTNYYGGNEALYEWTPSSSYTGISISYTGVTWTGIMVYQGCPTAGGTCIVNAQSSTTAKTTPTFNVTAGTTYYFWFDTWPTPTTPCAGSMTILGPCVAPTTQPTAYVPGATTASSIAGSFTASSPAASAYLVVRYPSGATPTNPVNGTTYTAGGALGLGTVVQASAATTFTATGLVPSTTYDFYIYGYNNTSCSGVAYNTVTPLTASATTAAPSMFITTALGGLWSSAASWVGGVVPPAANDVTITTGSTIIVDQVLNYNNLTINGTLLYNGTANATNLTGNLLISSGGTFLPYTTGGASVGNITIGGNFTNDGFANLSLANIIMNATSGSKTFDGTGTFTTDQNGKGVIRALLFASLGSLTIGTTQNLSVVSALANTNSFNPNGKLSIDNAAVVYGQAFNTQVASAPVTAMGSLYGASAPVTTAATATRWIASTAVSIGNIRFTASNIYVCTVAGTTSATAPSHTSGTATDGGATWLWVGTGGTVGNAFVPSTSPTVGTVYFYGSNLYICTTAGLPSAAAPPTCTGAGSTCVSGAATYRWIGTPAVFSVNYDVTSQTVRSLNIVSAGSGYPAAPAINIVTSTGTGSGASATATVFQQVGIATAFLNQISTASTYSSAFSAINNSQGVGSITVASGGANYTVAPAVGIGFPTSQNLVTAGGSGYTSAPTVVVSGGTTVTGFVNPSFTVTVNQGKVVSVYCSAGGSGYLTPPTLTLTGGGGSGATCAFVAGSLATATPVIGSNGQITSFTITNPGSGYVANPTCLLAGGTFTTTASTAPVARVGLYNISYGFFLPSPSAGTINASNEIPADRKVNALTINNTSIVFSNNLILTGTAPTTWTSGSINMGGNNLLYTWNGYNPGVLAGTNFGVKNGSITLTGRGGGLTGSSWNFPFVGNSFQAFTGTGTDGSNGSDILTMTVTETGPPSGGSPGFQPFGSRAFRVQTQAGTTYGTAPTVTMRWNSNDSIDGTAFPTLSNQGDLYVGEASALSGPYTLRTGSYGAGGLIPVLATLATSTSAPGPIANTTDKYYAYINTQVPPTITSFTPSNVCENAGIVTITGTGFKNITTASVSIGGTPPTFITSYTNTQIVCRVGAGTSGLITVTTSGGTATSASPITVTPISGLVAPTRVPSSGLICTVGGSVAFDATQTGAVSYNWTPTTGLSSTSTATTTASPSVTTQYQVDIDMGTCIASYITSAGVIPPFSFTPSSSVDTICFASPSVSVNMNANLSGSGFSVTSIPYTPATPPASGVTTLASGGVASVALSGGSLDDGGWGGIPIGFNYNFFGSSFNNLAVGTNGLVMFGPVPGYTTATGELGQFTFAGPPYFPNAGNPGNVIGLMLSDMLFTNINSSLRYWTDGIAPTRRFVLSGTYTQWSGGAATTVQLFLYESTGVVEIHITSSAATISRTVGLQDATKTIGAVAPGWSGRTSTLVTSEAWRFVPPAAYTFAWTGTGLSSTSIVNPVATISTNPTASYDNYVYTVTASNPITGCSSTQTDSFKVFNAPSAPTATNSTECSAPVIPSCSVSTSNPSYVTHTYNWYDVPTGGTAIQSGSSTTYLSSISETDTFYVAELNGQCESSRVMVIATLPTLGVALSPLAICSVGDSVIITVTPTMLGSTITLTGGTFTTLSSTTFAAKPSVTTNYTVTETLGACTLSKVVSVGVYSPTVFTPSSSVDTICFASPSVSVDLNSNLTGSAFNIMSTPFGLYTVPGSGVTTLATGGTASVALASGSLDDGGWSTIPLGFSYDFLGATFTSVNVGTNGTIMFGPYNGNGGFTAPYGLGDFSFASLPSTGEPFNMIAGCAVDLDASTGTVSYWTTGIAPNRSFVLYFNNVSGFGANGTHTFQIVLHETVGTAEVHIATGTSTNNKVVGCNNFDGTIGSMAPGYGKTGSITNEGWLFVPPATYTFVWTGTGLSSTTIGNPTATISTNPSGSYDTYGYVVTATNVLTGCSTSASDSFKVFATPTIPTATNSTECSNPVIPTCSVATTNPGFATHTYNWYDVATGGTALQTGSSTTYTSLLTATDTFYVSEVNGNCESSRVMVIATLPSLVVTSVPSTRLICNPGGSVSLTVARTMPGSSILWTGGYNSTPTHLTTIVAPATTTNYTVTETLGACVVSTQVGVGVLTSTPVLPTATPSTGATCTDTIQLDANLSASGFSITSRSYAPYTAPGSGIITLCDAGLTTTPQTSGSLDDGGWGAVPIGFTYNFLGTNYSTVNVGTNGVIHFGPYNAGSLGDFTYAGLPSVTEPFNIIAGCANDLYLFTSGTIRCWTTGVSPLRRFVVSYEDVPGISSGNHTFQIVLHETTGLAEVQMTEGSSTAAKTIGTNNGDGTIGAAAPGRNGFTGTIGNEGWNFNPPASYTYAWTPTTGLTSSTIANPKLAPIALAGTYPYTVAVTNPLTGCPNNGTVNVVRSYPVGHIYDTITTSGAYLFNGVYLTARGAYNDTLTNFEGCDSIETLHLTLVPNIGYVNDNMCYPMNVTPVLTSSSPYLTVGYANVNTHTDTFFQSNILSTMQAGEPIGSCGGSGLNNRTMWYNFKMPFCATPEVHISSDVRGTTNFDTRISVYRRSAPYLCSSPYTEFACNDNGTYYMNTGGTSNSTVVLTPNNVSPITNEYMPGEEVYVQSSGVGSASGNYGLIIDVEPYVPLATSVTAGSAVIDWTAVFASTWGSISGAYIQWRPVGAASTVSGTYRYVSAPSGTTTITGLTPGTAYEFWASYVCGNGGRWWSKKGTFTTGTTCVGTSPTIVSVVNGTPCNRPVITFNAPSTAYTSYRVALKRIGAPGVSISGVFYASATDQTYTTSTLVLGATYQFWVLAYCGTDRVDSSAITTFTICSSLRSAAPSNTTEEDKDVAYVLPNGDIVYGLPLNLIDLQIDVNNPNAQEINIESTDASEITGRSTETVVASVAVGEMSIYPNPATTSATLSYNLPKESASMNVRIVDAQGKEMLNDNLSNPNMVGTYDINLNNYSAGIYFVKVQAGEYIETKKLIVDRR